LGHGYAGEQTAKDSVADDQFRGRSPGNGMVGRGGERDQDALLSQRRLQ
jgi:hypothetical protein